MRIVSEFRDYYDSAVPYNDSCVWNRKTYKVLLNKTKKNDWFTYDQMKFIDQLWAERPILNGETDSIIFGMCGEISPIILLKDIPDSEAKLRPYEMYISNMRGHMISNISAHYTYEDYLIKRNKRYSKFPLTGNSNWRGRSFSSIFGRLQINSKTALINWKSSYLNPKDAKGIFVSISTPIFVIVDIDHEAWIIINPNLKEYGIHNLYDPWTMYQKLEQYLSNDLVDLKFPPFEMSQELKRDAHGFDVKSFKNEKGHKRGRN